MTVAVPEWSLRRSLANLANPVVVLNVEIAQYGHYEHALLVELLKSQHWISLGGYPAHRAMAKCILHCGRNALGPEASWGSSET